MNEVHNIDKSLEGLLVPIETLIPLSGNPRKGNLGAIEASYKEFGQVRPLVGVSNNDGTTTIIAGNHQLEVMKQLGWTHAAVAIVSLGDKKAVAFALADNRTTDLASTDDVLLFEMLSSVVADSPELMDTLGWDDFEIAALESTYVRSGGENPPVPGAPFFPPDTIDRPSSAGGSIERDPTEQRPRAIIQYNLVFESAEQQGRWYAFLRWLGQNYSGETTAERLLAFIEDNMS